MEEEIKIEDEMTVEVENTNKEKKIEPTTLEKEIQAEEESRKINKDNIENFKKSQKPKKSLKKKIIAWALGASIFAGAIAGGVAIYNNNFSDQAKYRKEIQTRYELADATLTGQLESWTRYGDLQTNKKVNIIRFNDENAEDVNLEVVFEGDAHNPVWDEDFSYYGTATFNVMLNYYESLVEAEKSDNMLDYLDALNNVFKNMEYVESEMHDKVDFLTNIEKTDANLAKINDLFKLDFSTDNIIRQVGFLPYNIQLVEESKDESDTERAYKYTYKLNGISFCETISENHDSIINDENLVIDKTYNSNKIKTYYRDILISCSEPLEYGRPDFLIRLAGDMYMFCNTDPENCKTNNDFKVETTYFQETNIFKEYLNMKETKNFNYNKPENVNMNDYLENAK